MKNGWHLPILIVLISIGMGCASAPKLANMVPQDERLVFESTGTSISLDFTKGGEETNQWTGSKISSQDFHAALALALERSGLFMNVETGDEADYSLFAFLVSQDQPIIGLNMEVSLTLRYRITDKATGEEIFDEHIRSAYTAAFGDALVGATRLRLANEGAVRTNIEQFIRQIAEIAGVRLKR